MSFSDLGVEPDMVEALREEGIETPFPIQEQTIPVALSGQDIIGQARTGTGKTLGFGLPLLQKLGTSPEPGVKALIVVPTRELAIQVAEDLVVASKHRDTQIAAIYGGKAYEGQIEQIEQGAQVVVGTPGRLLDLIQQRKLSIKHVEVMVLDEADKMLDLGFLPDVERLFSHTAETRHTMLFSATMPGPVLTLARRFMTKPLHIRAHDPEETLAQANIKHFVYRAHQLDKDEVIGRILQAEGRGKTIIFTRTKRGASRLVEELNDRGFPAAAVHGDLSQDARERAMVAFKEGKKDILIATDVAARGVDVDDVTHVINHTIPEDEKTYLHRVGRTGRANKTGIAVTFVDWDDLHKWALINRALEMGIDEPQETYSSSEHLFSDMNIAPGTKGRLKATPTPRPEKRAGTPPRSRGSRPSGSNQGSSTQGSSDRRSAGASSSQAGGSSDGRTRQRRRRRSGEGS